MKRLKGFRLKVELPASQVRRRLRGYGFGVRKVESAGKGQAIVIHTATGDHLRELRSLLGLPREAADAPEPPAPAEPADSA